MPEARVTSSHPDRIRPDPWRDDVTSDRDDLAIEARGLVKGYGEPGRSTGST